MKYRFRDFRITRTCTKRYSDYHSYKNALSEDFKHRCAYCNLLDTQITTPFEIDHYIPERAFTDVWPELKTTYSNLIYSCKKCNIAKSNQYEGDIIQREIVNELFYDPVQVDYDTIFYRNETGRICSDDNKGRDMIKRLKLYRPIHNLAWICDIALKTLEKMDAQINSNENNSERAKLLREAKEELNDYYITCNNTFTANYNNEKFKFLD